MKIKDLAKLVNGDILGDGEYEVKGISEIEDVKEGSLVFIFDVRLIDKFTDKLKSVAAIVPKILKECPCKSCIMVEDPKDAMIKTLIQFYHSPVKSFPGKKDNTHIGDAKIGKGVTIGDYTVIGDGTIIEDRVCVFPFTYIGHNVKVGEGSKIYPHCVILDRTIIGKNVTVYPGVVIGSDGFGYHKKEGKFVQKGWNLYYSRKKTQIQSIYMGICRNICDLFLIRKKWFFQRCDKNIISKKL